MAHNLTKRASSGRKDNPGQNRGRSLRNGETSITNSEWSKLVQTCGGANNVNRALKLNGNGNGRR